METEWIIKEPQAEEKPAEENIVAKKNPNAKVHMSYLIRHDLKKKVDNKCKKRGLSLAELHRSLLEGWINNEIIVERRL